MPRACKIQSSPVFSASRTTEGSYIFLLPPPLLKRKTVRVKRQNQNESESVNLLRCPWGYVKSGANGKVSWLLYTGTAECGRDTAEGWRGLSQWKRAVSSLSSTWWNSRHSHNAGLWQTSDGITAVPGNAWKSQSPPVAHWKTWQQTKSRLWATQSEKYGLQTSWNLNKITE